MVVHCRREIPEIGLEKKLGRMQLNNSQRGPFTVNIMNGVGGIGRPTLPLRPLLEPGRAGLLKAVAAGSRVHAIICMAEHAGPQEAASA